MGSHACGRRSRPPPTSYTSRPQGGAGTAICLSPWSGDNMPPAGMTSLLAGPAWCPCSWFCGTEEVLCQAFTCPWVGFSPRLPYLQRSGDHDDRKTQRRQYSPRLQKGARGAVRTPPSHRPYNGRSLSAPCYTPCGGHMTSKNGHCGDFFTGGTRSFCSAGLVTARGFCVILEGAAPTTSPPCTGNEPER